MEELFREPIPLFDYPVGSQTIGPFVVPAQAKRVEFEIARCTSLEPTIWPLVTTTLSVVVEREQGGSWIEVFSAFAAGGIAGIFPREQKAAGGNTPVGPASRVRARIQIAGGPLRTFGSLKVLG